MHIYTQ